MKLKWPSPEPLRPEAQPPADRYCDLVLTGGVTDGVVYPWALIELARAYRFKNIGGTSVGAMAAALAAAAEYGRRHGSLTGFNDVLRELPERLAEKMDDSGRTRIFSLFQPQKSTRRLFELFVALVGSGGFSLEAVAAGHTDQIAQCALHEEGAQARAKPPSKLRTLLRLYWLEALSGALLGLLTLVLFAGPGALKTCAVVLAIPPMVLFGVLLIGCGIYRDFVHGVVPNHFGMCTGSRADGAPAHEDSLIDWLHEGIQAAAGKPLDEPLTFKDLWDAPGGPGSAPVPPVRTKKPRSIDLRVITTNLTHGRPYEFPLAAADTRLFFKECELRDFFPATVVGYLVRNSAAYAPGSAADPDPSAQTKNLRELPKDRLPILVAARLSLSFPILFSALPLWAIDHEPEHKEDRAVRRCRFTDGGVCSNFPIHLFDSAVPEWPTFGISLGPRTVYRARPVDMTVGHDEGAEQAWYRFDDERSLLTGKPMSAWTRLIGFLGSVIYSAKDWNDKTAMRMPGARDRVAYVALNSKGGLNLRLTPEDIRELATSYGQPAGRAIVDKFTAAAGAAPTAWDQHRWVRFNTFVVGLRERVERLHAAAQARQYGTPLSAQIQDAKRRPPLTGTDDAARTTLTPAQAQDLEALLDALKELEAKFAAAALPQPYKPVPSPRLQIRAPL